MASLYEPSYLTTLFKPDHQIPKPSDSLIKLEKLSHFESFNLTYTRCADLHKVFETGKPCKARLGVKTRGEPQTVIEPKSASQKLQTELLPVTSKVPFLPLLSIRTNALEELFKELKELKSCVTDLEEKNKINTQCIQVNKLKIASLEDCQEKLKKKAGFGLSYEEKKEELQNRLKDLQAEWKQSTEQMKNSLVELELQAKVLTNKEDLIIAQMRNPRLQKNDLKERSLGDSRSYEILLNHQPKVLFHSPSANLS